MSSRFEKLGKLSLAILENYVETVLGEKFVDELREPTDQLIAVATALEYAEARFVKQFEDRTFAENIFKQQISKANYSLLADVVGKFYTHPTDPDFPSVIKRIMTDSLPSMPVERIDKATDFYIGLLTEELALTDETFRERVRVLAELRSEKRQQEMKEVLQRIEVVLTYPRPQGQNPLYQISPPLNASTNPHTGQVDTIHYYSCFISYSHEDQLFAERLYNDLHSNGVRCWFAPEDLRIGDAVRKTIDQEIRLQNKLLVILSENSVKSEWVGGQVEAAFEEEIASNRLILFPIRLDETVMQTRDDWAAAIRRRRHIGDFSNWKDNIKYASAFKRLLRDLKSTPV
jgi:hypothetical protein